MPICVGLMKYNDKIYQAFADSFNALPLGALVNKQFLCMHGGLSPDLRTLADFKQVIYLFFC